MATKPTKRILDWASGGTATDPGAGKEAAGWLVSERPPAYWWNWILQSFGDWLTWGETSIDDLETDVAANNAHVAGDGSDHANVAQVWGIVESATAGIVYNGAGIISVTESSGDLIIDFGVNFDATTKMAPFVTVQSLTGAYNCAVEIVDVNTIELHVREVKTPATSLDVDLGVVALTFSVAVFGILA